MKRAQFTTRAQADLKEIAHFIAQRNPERAEPFVDEIIAHCHKIATQAGVGRARPDIAPGIRSIPHDSYVIFYKIIDAGVEIVHVFHGARDAESLF